MNIFRSECLELMFSLPLKRVTEVYVSVFICVNTAPALTLSAGVSKYQLENIFKVNLISSGCA